MVELNVKDVAFKTLSDYEINRHFCPLTYTLLCKLILKTMKYYNRSLTLYV